MEGSAAVLEGASLYFIGSAELLEEARLAVEAEGLEEASLIGSTEGLMAAMVESLNHQANY